MVAFSQNTHLLFPVFHPKAFLVQFFGEALPSGEVICFFFFDIILVKIRIPTSPLCYEITSLYDST